VLAERRRELHRTIGLAIEELYSDRLAELYETLAHHFERAEEWERALAYHERAAEKGVDNFANRAVMAHCRQALAIAERLGDRVPDDRRRVIEERLGAASFYASEFHASAESYERAAARTTAPAQRAGNLCHASLSALWAHTYVRAEAATEAVLELARRHGLRGAEAFGLTVRGWQASICRGDLAEWDRCLEQARSLVEPSGDEGTLAFIRFNLAMAAEWTGDYRRAITLSEQCVAAGRRFRLPHLVVWPEWFLGKAYCCLGDYGRAIARLTEAAEVCDRIGDRAWTSRLMNTLGWVFAEIGSPARAREYNERAAALAQAMGDPEIVSNSEINLAGNWLALGDVGRASGYLEPIRAALASPGDPWMRWRYALHAIDVGGRIALAAGRPEEALAAASEEAAGACQHRATKLEARALVLRGGALVAMDRRAEAEGALREAVRVAESIEYPRAAWEALRLLAEVKRRAGAVAEAERVLARRRVLVEAAAGSLPDAELRRVLVGAAG